MANVIDRLPFHATQDGTYVLARDLLFHPSGDGEVAISISCTQAKLDLNSFHIFQSKDTPYDPCTCIRVEPGCESFTLCDGVVAGFQGQALSVQSPDCEVFIRNFHILDCGSTYQGAVSVGYETCLVRSLQVSDSTIEHCRSWGLESFLNGLCLVSVSTIHHITGARNKVFGLAVTAAALCTLDWVHVSDIVGAVASSVVANVVLSDMAHISLSNCSFQNCRGGRTCANLLVTHGGDSTYHKCFFSTVETLDAMHCANVLHHERKASDDQRSGGTNNHLVQCVFDSVRCQEAQAAHMHVTGAGGKWHVEKCETLSIRASRTDVQVQACSMYTAPDVCAFLVVGVASAMFVQCSVVGAENAKGACVAFRAQDVDDVSWLNCHVNNVVAKAGTGAGVWARGCGNVCVSHCVVEQCVGTTPETACYVLCNVSAAPRLEHNKARVCDKGFLFLSSPSARCQEVQGEGCDLSRVTNNKVKDATIAYHLAPAASTLSASNIARLHQVDRVPSQLYC